MTEHTYEDHMNVMDYLINELIITRTIQETEKFEMAVSMLMLQQFPYVSEEGEIIENMFKEYCKDYTVKEWYESLFKENYKIKKR